MMAFLAPNPWYVAPEPQPYHRFPRQDYFYRQREPDVMDYFYYYPSDHTVPVAPRNFKPSRSRQHRHRPRRHHESAWGHRHLGGANSNDDDLPCRSSDGSDSDNDVPMMPAASHESDSEANPNQATATGSTTHSEARPTPMSHARVPVQVDCTASDNERQSVPVNTDNHLEKLSSGDHDLAARVIQRNWGIYIKTRSDRVLLRGLKQLRALGCSLDRIMAESYSATTPVNKLKYIEDTLTKELMKCDAILTHGDTRLREAKKQYVKRVMAILDDVDGALRAVAEL